jgi:hypothetical protein
MALTSADMESDWTATLMARRNGVSQLDRGHADQAESIPFGALDTEDIVPR